ncbi:MAG: DUF5652 family protein [Patescibacteria group bacterium]
MDYHITTAQLWLITLIVVWDFVWKALGLWRASQRNEKGWFVAILVINSVGIFPIIYLMVTTPKSTKQ